MKTLTDVMRIIERLKYKDWTFVVNNLGHGFYVQLRFFAPDNNNPSGPLELQACRKWYISPYMTDSEVVQTAWHAVRQAEEHEVRENFTYNGIRIFTPHPDVDALAIHHAKTPEDSRPRQ